MPQRIEAVQFSRPLKSQLGYELLAAVSAGRVRMYAGDGSGEWREFWGQETYILRESRVESALPETDLFAGLG